MLQIIELQIELSVRMNSSIRMYFAGVPVVVRRWMSLSRTWGMTILAYTRDHILQFNPSIAPGI